MAIAVAVVVLRRPDAVTLPQFYAEDGTFWFADAYNHGLTALLQGNAGYLQTLPRLVAVPASHLDLVHAALLFNLVAIVIQAAPAAFVLSGRFDPLAPHRVRVALALAYVLLPSAELDANITNAQWHLAVLAALVLAARPHSSRWWRIFDLAVIALSGLTGPFSVVLLPAALLQWSLSPDHRRWRGLVSLALLATLVAQAVVFVQSHRGTGAALGAGLGNLVGIVADRVVLAASFAEEGHGRAHVVGRPLGTVAAAVITLVAVGVVAVAARQTAPAVRTFLLVCFGVTVAALASPLVIPGGPPAWQVFATTGGGGRYFFTAELAWLVCAAAVIGALRGRTRTVVAAALAIVFLSGPVSSWSYPAYSDLHLGMYDARLRATPVGTTVQVPINPNWTMSLTRH